MIKVYIADSIPDAHLVSSLLKSHGIANRVINENLTAAYGEIPPNMDTSPAVCILDDERHEEALTILAENIKGFKAEDDYRSILEIALEKAVKHPMVFLVAGIIIVLILLIWKTAAI